MNKKYAVKTDADILKFVNSKDIRKHLIESGYKLCSLEAAWLIHQCRDATIEEKHQAWHYIIDAMPDCTYTRRDISVDSLHRFLADYMELEERLVNEFVNGEFNSGKFVYDFEYRYKDGADGFRFNTVFSSFLTIYETIMEADEDVVEIICTRMKADDIHSAKRLYLSPDLNIMRIYPEEIECEEEARLFYEVFQSMWFEFPVPFKKGDIVWNPETPELGCCSGPFVLNGVCTEGLNEKTAASMRKNGDITDMCAGGYFLNEDGSIYSECAADYMNLQLYKKELTGSERTLIPLSSFLKGEIDFVLFAKAYHQIVTEGYAQRSFPREYMEKGLLLAGLKNDV